MSDRVSQVVIQNNENFRSLLNINTGKNSEITTETARLINSEVTNQVSRKMNQVKRGLNSQILDTINAAINEKLLPSIHIFLAVK